jgi:hypothetical protein
MEGEILMVRSFELKNCLFAGILSLDFSEKSSTNVFFDRNLFQMFEQHLNDTDIQTTFSYEALFIYKLSASNNYE